MELRRGSLTALPDSVQRLALNDTEVTSQCLAPLPGHDPAANGVTELDLSDNDQLDQLVSPLVVAYIAETFSQVKVLKINRCQGYCYCLYLVAFAEHPLEALEVQESLINDDDIRVYLPVSLRRLNIAGCQRVTLAGAIHMEAELTNLQYLDVRGCPGLMDKAVLRYLNLPTNNEPLDDYESLQTMMPQCEVVPVPAYLAAQQRLAALVRSRS